ncbi:polyprenyl synthetase family protein [Variovorax sp. GT1P44]|uniref:polyprenyl synthetase family protein n=1 Tax=Variovorax sp. GT1P44 TaxID=3443742 RepID=UPI003F467BF7
MTLDTFHDRLSGYRETTLAGLLSAVPKREPQRYLYEPVTSYLLRTGKSIRPALCIATCKAFGGDPADAVASATAIEMLHNAFLVHDDVEDDSELRRGLPTLHAEHGVPIAINAGDMLTALSVRILRENLPALGPTLTWRVYDEFEHMMQQSLEGQAMELGWVRDNRCDITDEDYLRMVLKKTCWYSFIHPCRIGALIGTMDGVDLNRFNRFGNFLGTAFQIQDDLLNLTGDEERYGKEIGGDLLEGKRTLMLIHLLRQLDTREARRVTTYLGQPRTNRSPQDTRWILDTMRARGSLDHARRVTKQLAGAALYEFTQAFGDLPDSDEKRFLNQVISYMVSRDV